MKILSSFRPFMANAFVTDIQLFAYRGNKRRTKEQRLKAMSWCDVCGDHTAEVELGKNGVDTGLCLVCGTEQVGFN